MAIQLGINSSIYFRWDVNEGYGHNTYAPGYYKIELYGARGANGVNGCPGGKGGGVVIYVTLLEACVISFDIGAMGDGRNPGWNYRHQYKDWVDTLRGGTGGIDGPQHAPNEWGGGGGAGSRVRIDGASAAYAGGGGGGAGLWFSDNDPGGPGGNSYWANNDNVWYQGRNGYSGNSVHYGGGGGGGGFYGGGLKTRNTWKTEAAGGRGGTNNSSRMSSYNFSITSCQEYSGVNDGHGYGGITFLGYLSWSISWTRMKNVNRNTAMAGDLIYGDADITATRYNAKGQKFYVNPAYGIFSSISYSNVDSPSITNDGLHFQGYQRHRQTAYVAANFYRYIITCDEHCYLVNGEDVLLPGNRYRVKLKHTKVGILLFRYWTISGGLNVTYPARDEIEFEMPNGNVSVVAHFPNRLNTDAYKDIKEQDSFLYEKIE